MDLKLTQKLLNPLRRQIQAIVSRGKIHSINDTHEAQASFLADETKDEVEIIQHYGFTSRPLKGSECIGICAGNRDGLVIIATGDKRHRKALKPGEVALYTDEGDSLHFKRGGHLAVQAKKFTVSNAQGELMSLLAQLANILEGTVVVTSDGPKPLSTKGELRLIAEKLGSFTEK